MICLGDAAIVVVDGVVCRRRLRSVPVFGPSQLLRLKQVRYIDRDIILNKNDKVEKENY